MAGKRDSSGPAPEAASSGSSEADFVRSIREQRETGQLSEAVLRTDDRVLARITDGIYRQPSSALRELISNAYDADATAVHIETDAPRFHRIRVRDNGIGMTEEALSRMIHHIGGSSKRTTVGPGLGTTSSKDPSRSPKGRKLIGKIGIGLFSVSQLTSRFQIITKVAGTNYRLVADVVLRTYSENDDEPGDGTFETGTVRVISVPADDKKSHGTEIVLLDLRPRARDLLRSKERWEQLSEQLQRPENERERSIYAPPFNIGLIERDSSSEDSDFQFKEQPRLPWESTDKPAERFRKLFDGVVEQSGMTSERPDLAKTLDNYLGTLWTLSLSAPVRYLGKHPFDLDAGDEVEVFRLSNIGRGKADAVKLKKGQTVREALNLKSGAKDPAGGFQVFMDEVELLRPISFQFLQGKKQAVARPMLFVGSYKPDLSKVSADVRGGDLDFEGYLFWNSKIVPKENNGVLVRINGASGALFDDTFMKYQVSEQTRLRQITSEIFVDRGLDAALNIDRESFNFAHPHYQILSNWVHRGLRQLANTHKAIGDEARTKLRAEVAAAKATKLEQFAARTWHDARREPDEEPPEIEIASTEKEAAQQRKRGVLSFQREQLPAMSAPQGTGRKVEAKSREQMLKAIATVLDGFGVLESLSFAEQHELLNALLAVYFEDAQSS